MTFTIIDATKEEIGRKNQVIECSDITTLWGQMMQMGLREANQNFSKAIKAVKAGQEGGALPISHRVSFAKPSCEVGPFWDC